MNLTNHASKRCQQRGFTLSDIELLQIYGNHRISYGCDVYYLSKSVNRKAFKGGKPPKAIERLCGTKCVIADNGTVVTVCHINRRLKFN